MKTMTSHTVNAQRLQTFRFLVRESLLHGYVEPFVRRRLESLPRWKRWAYPFPYAVRARAWMLVFAARAYARGFVHPMFAGNAAIGVNGKPEPDMAGIELPDFLRGDMVRLADIEPALYPSDTYLAKFHVYETPVDPALGNVYGMIRNRLRKMRYDVIVVAPWLLHGGADKGILQYLNYYVSKHEAVLLVTTLPDHSHWLDQVDQGVEVIELGRAAMHLSDGDQELLLIRLVLDLEARRLHCVQSDLAYRTIAAYGRQLRSVRCSVVISAFAHEIAANGIRIGYVEKYFPQIRTFLDRVICDSQAFCVRLAAQYALPAELFHFVPFSIVSDAHSFRKISIRASHTQRKRLLWAGRISYSKAPDLLLAVARATPDIDYFIYGAPDDLAKRYHHELGLEGNVILCGRYEDFADILLHRHHDGFLYTSRFDGTPNVLLEAAAGGLPIVAPAAVGGIGELITTKTGYPYLDNESVEQCVQAIRKLFNDSMRQQKVAALQALVSQRHSVTSFMAAMDAASGIGGHKDDAICSVGHSASREVPSNM